MADHSTCLREERTAVQKRSVLLTDEALAKTIVGASVQGARRLQSTPKMGAWLTVQPSTVNGIECGAQEWQDAIFLRYGQDPPDLPHYCNVCNIKISICHALDCKSGGLVTALHNKIRDRVADLARKAFTPSHMLNDPLIFAG